jgi:hypothetical protein
MMKRFQILLSNSTCAATAWDEYLRCVKAEIHQVKTSKMKIAAFVAGVDRHSCWFCDWGDVLATEIRQVYNEEDLTGTWMFPDLVKSKAPGTAVGGYIKALLLSCRDGATNSKTYADVAATSLPDGANAAGIRAGAANALHVTMPEVGRCTLTLSKSVLKAPMVSALESKISQTAFNCCFQFQLAPLHRGVRHHDDRA